MVLADDMISERGGWTKGVWNIIKGKTVSSSLGIPFSNLFSLTQLYEKLCCTVAQIKT